MEPQTQQPLAGESDRLQSAAFLAVAGYLAIYLIWLAIGVGDRELIGDLAFLPITAVAALAAWRAGDRADGYPGVRRGWRLISLALVVYFFGNVAQLVEETGPGLLVSESTAFYVAESLYFVFYPLFLAGILCFPWGTTGPHERRPLALLDAILIATAGVTFIWYVVLGPTAYTDTGQDLVEKLFAISYPAGDLALIVALSRLWLGARETGLARPLKYLTVALLFYIVGDVAYNLVTLNSTYSGGSWVDAPWVIAIGLFVLAAVSQPALEEGAVKLAPRAPGRVPILVAALPFLAVAAVFTMLIGTQAYDTFFPGLSLTLTAALVAALLSVRQFLSQRSLATANRELHEAHDELAALATTDPLTALPNHRALVEAMDRELERAERYGRECSLLFFDIDFFKSLNDACGHVAGDTVLSELGQAVRGALRKIDTLGRWGGEEFVAVLPEIDADAAMITAERVRSTVAEHPFALAEGTHITVSVGAASYPRDGHTRSALLDAADRAMYTAKRMGRNQVFSAADPAVEALLRGVGTASEMDERATMGAVDALAMLVDTRDKGTAHHISQVARLAERTALSLGCSPARARDVFLAAKLHDIGKVTIADSILQKPGRLTEEEWALMREHPATGAEVLSRIARLANLAPIIRSHHERFDGSGYPDGLKGEEIPLEARIVGAVDALDAMLSDRPYRKRLSIEEARAELRRGAGAQFDPQVVAALERLLAKDRASRAA